MNATLALDSEQVDDDFRALVEMAPDAVFLADAVGHLVFVNDAACAMSGWPRSQLLGRPIDRLLAGHWPRGGETPPSPWQHGRLDAAPSVLRRADGSPLDVRVTARMAAGGRIQAWAREAVPPAQAADDPGRRRMQHTLSANERLLQTVFDLLPVGIWMADQAGWIVGNNPAAERIWGGAHYTDLPHHGDYKGWRVDTGEPIAPEDSAMARAITQGETTPRELVRIQGFDGSFKTIINSGAPLRNEDGDITGAIVVNEDITLLHEAQEKQRASEELLRTVFNLLPVGVWIADRDGEITLSNPAAEHMWSGEGCSGPPSGNVTYKAWWAETGAPIAESEWALARALRGESARNELIRIQCFDGSTRTMMNWAAPIRSAAGEIIGAAMVNEDVTSLQYTQEQLRSAVHGRERILAVVAHDLRNPLAALMAHAAVVELAARRLAGGEKVVAQAASMVDIVRRMSGLVKDLLSVSAAGAGGHHMLVLSPVDPSSLLSRAAEAMRPLMAEKGLALDIRPAEELPALRADADRILRVLGNLLDNALKFTEPGGRVTIAAKATTAGVRFSVANSGAPVAEPNLEVMFQPFWQAGGDKAGTGLGLAICRSIVEAHGGTIWAEPSEGQRLRVCFVIPRG
ncbi:MAG: PAS domain-containing sensor histidine kinase [Ramlibacter sp.]|nr:PAS domain-containing sensor histidine kinase [Ramlibacter sp.]